MVRSTNLIKTKAEDQAEDEDSMARQDRSDASTLAAPLMRCAFLMMDTHLQVSKAFGLPPQQAHLLCAIGERAPSIGEAGGFLRVEKSTMTGLVGRAEAAGLLERLKDGEDARATRLRLTPQGLRLAERFKAEVTRRIEAMAETLPEADRIQLARSLLVLVETHQARETGLSRSAASRFRSEPPV